CTGPQNCVVQNRASADPAILPNNGTATNPRARVDHCARMHRRPPSRRFDMRRPPTFVQNDAMNLEIFRARTEVEPLSFLKHHAADLSALRDPISENRDE